MSVVLKWVQSLLCRVVLFLRRHHCLIALLLVIIVVATATIWALFFAPDKIRKATLKIEKGAKKVAQLLPARLPRLRFVLRCRQTSRRSAQRRHRRIP